MKPIEEILVAEASGIASLVGGGGKTSLMFHLARQLAGSGRRVLTTTTTRIFMPTLDQSATVLIDADPKEILKQVVNCRQGTKHATAAASSNAGKLTGFAPEAIQTFAESGLFDWIIVEADGSARRPLKAPAEHEPVIPANTTVLVSVAGLEVLDAPLSEDLVFRSELAGRLMKLAPGETITESSLVNLLVHPDGAFKGAPPAARRFIFLNKADDRQRLTYGARIAQMLRLSPCPVALALVVGQALDGVRVHAVYPLEPRP